MGASKGKGRGRPGGNPDFGTKYKFSNGDTPPRTKVLAMRFTEEEMKRIKEKFGDRYTDFCRNLILAKLEDA